MGLIEDFKESVENYVYNMKIINLEKGVMIFVKVILLQYRKKKLGNVKRCKFINYKIFNYFLYKIIKFL